MKRLFWLLFFTFVCLQISQAQQKYVFWIEPEVEDGRYVDEIWSYDLSSGQQYRVTVPPDSIPIPGEEFSYRIWWGSEDQVLYSAAQVDEPAWGGLFHSALKFSGNPWQASELLRLQRNTPIAKIVLFASESRQMFFWSFGGGAGPWSSPFVYRTSFADTLGQPPFPGEPVPYTGPSLDQSGNPLINFRQLLDADFLNEKLLWKVWNLNSPRALVTRTDFYGNNQAILFDSVLTDHSTSIGIETPQIAFDQKAGLLYSLKTSDGSVWIQRQGPGTHQKLFSIPDYRSPKSTQGYTSHLAVDADGQRLFWMEKDRIRMAELWRPDVTIITLVSGINPSSFFMALSFGYVPTGREQTVPPTPGEGRATLTMYPNPVLQTGTFTFELDRPGLINLEIFDMLGRSVHSVLKEPSGVTGMQTIHADLSGLPDGVYLARLQVEDRIVTTTFVKKSE